MSLLPFHIQTKMFTGSENTFYAAAAQMKVASYFNLRKRLEQMEVVAVVDRPDSRRPQR